MTIVSFLMLAACGGSDGGGGANGSPANIDKYCDTMCSKMISCVSGGITQSECTEQCTTPTTRNTLGRLREDFLSRVESCFQGGDCAKAKSGDLIDTCIEDTQTSFAPSETVKSVCTDLEATAQRCNDGSLPMNECLRSLAPFTDDIVSGIRACLDDACETWVDCVNEALTGQKPAPVNDAG